MYNVKFKYSEIRINLQFLFSQVISDLRFKTTFAIRGFYLRVNTVDLLFKPRLASVYESPTDYRLFKRCFSMTVFRQCLNTDEGTIVS